MNLDGEYKIQQVMSRPNHEDQNRMETVIIKDGHSHMEDIYGCVWDTHYEIVDDQHVKMTAKADQSHADMDHPLSGESGRASGENLTFESVLKVSHKDNDVHMSGQINIGDDVVIITLHKT